MKRDMDVVRLIGPFWTRGWRPAVMAPTIEPVVARSQFVGVLTVVACLLVGPAFAAQSSELPLSKTAYAAAVEMMTERLHPIPLGEHLLSLVEESTPQEWHVTCSRDDLTGETESCWLTSPYYLPVGWTRSASRCWSSVFSVGGRASPETESRLLAACLVGFRLATGYVNVWCGGTVSGAPLYEVSRFMVGDEVVAIEGEGVAGTLFTSPDGSWADKGTFAFEATKSGEIREQIFRFVPDSAAVQEFLAECSTGEE